MSLKNPGDTDLDGLSDLDEYRYNSNPLVKDSDGDGTEDGPEHNNGSHPGDGSDGGQPIPSGDRLSIKLGVGDRSGSESEDYVLNVFTIDPQTGQEKRFYTLRSGGHGQYTESTKSFFRKGTTYTFQIDWQGTNGKIKAATQQSGAEGPDFDYHMVVEPQGSFDGHLIDSYDTTTKTVRTDDPILDPGDINPSDDDDDNVQDFLTRIEPRRVALVAPALEWVAIEGFENLDDHVDPWTNETKGKRVFPCYKNPDDTEIRHKLKLVVKGGLKGVPVFVKAFDIDDGTSEDFDQDFDTLAPVIDTNGKAGNDNLTDFLNTAKAGHFWDGSGWGSPIATKTLDATGKAEFDFRVGMQPGSNYRVVASVLDESGFDGVQTGDAEASGYLGPELAQNGGKLSSFPLTVWRRLWVENDSMEAIPIDANGHKDNDISRDLTEKVIREVISDGTETRFTIDSPQDHWNATNLENGKILIQNEYHDVTNVAELQVPSGYRLIVWIQGDHDDIPVGTPFKLYDDDDFGLLNPPLPRHDLVDETMKNVFKPAFIEVVDAVDYNPRKTLEFHRNYPVLIGPWGFQHPGIWDDAIDQHDKRELWVANLIAGYQGDRMDDHDPNDEKIMEGVTNGETRSYSIIYVETIRDNQDGYLRGVSSNHPELISAANTEILKNITLTASHEIGHMPGGGDEKSHHGEDGLMNEDGYDKSSKFEPQTIRRFRSTHKWQQP